MHMSNYVTQEEHINASCMYQNLTQTAWLNAKLSWKWNSRILSTIVHTFWPLPFYAQCIIICCKVLWACSEWQGAMDRNLDLLLFFSTLHATFMLVCILQASFGAVGEETEWQRCQIHQKISFFLVVAFEVLMVTSGAEQCLWRNERQNGQDTLFSPISQMKFLHSKLQLIFGICFLTIIMIMKFW